MAKITSTAALRSAIQELELRQAEEWAQLKEQFLITYENLKPLNVLKNNLKEFASAPLKGGLVNVGLGVAAGFLAKFFVFGTSQNLVKKVLGNLLETGISALVAKNPEVAKTLLDKVISLFSKAKTDPST